MLQRAVLFAHTVCPCQHLLLPRMQSPQKHSHGVQLALLPPSLRLSAVPARSTSVAPSLGYTSTHCTNSLHVQLPGSNCHCDCVSFSKEQCCSQTPCTLGNTCCLTCNRLKSIHMVCSWLCCCPPSLLCLSAVPAHSASVVPLLGYTSTHIAPIVCMCSFQVATAIVVASRVPKSTKERCCSHTQCAIGNISVASHTTVSMHLHGMQLALLPPSPHLTAVCQPTVRQWHPPWAMPAHTLHQESACAASSYLQPPSRSHLVCQKMASPYDWHLPVRLSSVLPQFRGWVGGKKETVGGPWSRVRRGTVCPRADDEGLRAGIVASRAQPSRLMMITCVNGYGLCVFFVVHRPKRYLWCSEHKEKFSMEADGYLDPRTPRSL